jgi:XTP/dITP diphosphohydrolase
MKLVFATHNSGKIIEMRQILSGLSLDIVSADEAGVPDDVEEDGQTFAANALKKARFVSERSGQWAVADDSGLCVEALNGEPGVHSARYAGAGVGGMQLVEKVLAKTEGLPSEKRQATFVSTVALVSPEGKHWVFSGTINGSLTTEPHGPVRPKLPYDVIFIPDGYNKTFAEMSNEEKNSLSHRGLAFRKLRDFITQELAGQLQ